MCNILERNVPYYYGYIYDEYIKLLAFEGIFLYAIVDAYPMLLSIWEIMHGPRYYKDFLFHKKLRRIQKKMGNEK